MGKTGPAYKLGSAGREIPFEGDAVCDSCGAIGAFDVMGDYFCEQCMKDFTQEDADRVT
jgi:hypothetical protein